MGNEKSNSYWEAELPPNYDRVGIENFIRAKYDFWSDQYQIMEFSYSFYLFFYRCLHLIMLIYIYIYISVRYEEKRWVPRDGKAISHSRESQQKASAYRPRPGGSGAHRYTNNVEHSSDKKNIHPPNTNSSIPASKSRIPAASKVSKQVVSCSFVLFVLIFLSSFFFFFFFLFFFFFFFSLPFASFHSL